MAVEGPLEWVKGSLKVSQRVPRTCLGYWVDPWDKSNGSNTSIASLCFDRAVVLQDQGFGEDDIRAVISSIYMGEVSHYYGGGTTLPD